MSNKKVTRGSRAVSGRKRATYAGKTGQSRKKPATPKKTNSKSSARKSNARRPVSTRRSGAARRSRRGGGGRKRRARSFMGLRVLGRALKFTAYWSAICAIWAGLFVVGLFGYYSLTMPDPHLAGLTKTTPGVKIVGSDGTVLASRGRQRRHVYLEDLPPHAIDAVLQTEDARFYSHIGVDFWGLGRATLVNLEAGRVVQGGSTITQQLAKNLYLKSHRTFGRKAHELSLAFWLESVMTKDEILELYLNRVYFGAGAYGLGQAAHVYFGKSASDLSLAQAAILAGLLKAPSRYALTHNIEGAKKRAHVVLSRMVASGKISRKQAAVAFAKPLQVANRVRYARGYNYAVDWISDLVPRLVGGVNSNLVVETTIDPKLQVHAQRTVEDVMAGASEMLAAGQASAVVVDHVGAVKALVGGRSYSASQFNRAVDAKRQPGSAFKPFVYLSALEAGYGPKSTVVDAPLKIGDWRPKNASGKFAGAMTLRESLAKSVNTVSVKLTMDVGPSKVMKVAKRLGISSKLRRDASLALGTSEVSLLELTSAYVPFANGGMAARPHVIKSIRTADGEVLYRRDAPRRARVIAARHVDAMDDMMRAVVSWGTGKAANIRTERVAGKTGTSQDFRDAWFVGYTPRLAGGVWIGNDEGQPMLGVSGGDLPAKMWRKIMAGPQEGQPKVVLRGARLPRASLAAASAPDRTDSIGQLLRSGHH